MPWPRTLTSRPWRPRTAATRSAGPARDPRCSRPRHHASAATAPSTRRSTGCSTVACPPRRSRWSPVAARTSSPGRWVCPTTRSRPPARSSTRCATSDPEIGLGRADDRWFTFCAGLGLDADVVGAVERRREDGRRSTGRLYVASAVREFFSADRDSPPLTLQRNGSEDVEGLLAGDRAEHQPVDLLRQPGHRPVPRRVLRSRPRPLRAARPGHADHVAALPPAPVRTQGAARPTRRRAARRAARSRSRSDRPTAHQVDGDYLGERTEVTFRSVPDALRVLI